VDVHHGVGGNPQALWMHVLKREKVVDEIVEHVVEKRVRRDIWI
jgi:hypothetical protein